MNLIFQYKAYNLKMIFHQLRIKKDILYHIKSDTSLILNPLRGTLIIPVTRTRKIIDQSWWKLEYKWVWILHFWMQHYSILSNLWRWQDLCHGGFALPLKGSSLCLLLFILKINQPCQTNCMVAHVKSILYGNVFNTLPAPSPMTCEDMITRDP